MPLVNLAQLTFRKVLKLRQQTRMSTSANGIVAPTKLGSTLSETHSCPTTSSGPSQLIEAGDMAINVASWYLDSTSGLTTLPMLQFVSKMWQLKFGRSVQPREADVWGDNGLTEEEESLAQSNSDRYRPGRYDRSWEDGRKDREDSPRRDHASAYQEHLKCGHCEKRISKGQACKICEECEVWYHKRCLNKAELQRNPFVCKRCFEISEEAMDDEYFAARY